MKIKPINFIFISIFLLLVSVSFAQTPTQNLSVSGLKDSVTVRRDGRGIPYIEAKNDADLFFAQGYVTAQDRLWQMDLFRRVARGETAEIFGKAALDEDRRWRKLGFAQIVEEAKVRIIETTLASEFTVLARLLSRIAAGHWPTLVSSSK